ncbi:MAG: methylated-DNA--[protein]-cysteine S-methyltransferase [Thermodesulfovibrionales bacterium]|nr:methylated-DNA--[protein]-cysteine S-methyltransferase [Thermodesulfovibrionales bacterium]
MREKRSSSIDSFYDIFESPIGFLYLLFHEKTLRGISFRKPVEIIRRGSAPPLIKKELREYFDNGIHEFTQPILLMKGTEFEKTVWLALKEIPYGETKTYKWLSEKIDKPAASRAVGQALSKNPLPIVLPCHRVIESDGSLGGYSAGTNIKRRLLDIEYYKTLAKKQ